jgi:tRNA-specific 2-thiouridylase
MRVVVAMSGGVDSSVTAALMKREGHDVIGITLQLYSDASSKKNGTCCAGQDIYDARRVASLLDIPHYVLDFEAKFRERVIRDFAETYARGETPVPCVRCNERVKFADLMDMAREVGGDALATGHYVRRVDGPDGAEMHVASDARRDQSYFLFATTAKQLCFLRFPLGALEKSAVRAIATELDLPVAAKPDSQDICFVPDGDYAKLVTRLIPDAAAAGDVVDMGGRVLARHGGVAHFTIGQRKGLGLSGNAKPVFVVGIDESARRVVVGPREALAVRTIVLREVNWLAEAGNEMVCTVKVRSSRPPVPARLTRLSDCCAHVELLEPEYGVAPGQACVFYDGPRVLGGGWIARNSEQRAVA